MRRAVAAGSIVGLVLVVPLVMPNVGGNETALDVLLPPVSALLFVAVTTFLPRWLPGLEAFRGRLMLTAPAVTVAFLVATAILLSSGWGVTFAATPGRIVLGVLALLALLAGTAVSFAAVGWAAGKAFAVHARGQPPVG